jgi:WD40 repeat protein
VDPPERAVNGNLGDWWGAGGPAPQWIEVDLEGIYSVSKIKVINQGPTGRVAYKVFGRGPDHQNRLLHTFDGNKSENQTLEFSPTPAWDDVSTIRIEINSGSGWVGLREIQVFSREDPKPLPGSTESTSPSFLAQVDTEALTPLTPENVILLNQLALLGRGTINELAWSPDGKTLAAVGALGIWLYDPASPFSPPRLLEGHTREVLNLSFSLDGQSVLSGSQDGTVKLWDVTTGDLQRIISLWDDFSYEVGEQKRDKEVWSMAFSPDGKLLASGGFDGKLRLWNLSTSRQRTVLKGHSKQIANLVFSPDGMLLASYGIDGNIFVWDVETGKQRAALSSPGMVQSLIFSPDGKTLAYGGAGMTVRLWDVETGKERVELSEHTGVLSLAFSPDGLLASSGLIGTVRLWDEETGTSGIFRERAGWIMNMVYSPDGTWLATYAWDGSLRLWETATGNLRADLATHTSPVTSVAFSPDTTILASGGEDGSVRLWEIGTNKLRATLWGHVARVSSVAFSASGGLLASGGFDGNIRLWDTLSGRQIAVFSGHENFVRCVAFSPDGKTVASGSTDKTVRLWDVATGQERAVLTGHEGEVQSVAFSPDGAWLLSASVDKTLRIWEVATGKESGVLRGHLSFVIDATFSPAGNLIASAGGDHGLRMWDWEVVSGKVTGTHHFPPIGHPGWVLSVDFSPDGKILASANLSTTSYWVAPGEVHLYSADTGYPFALLRGHTRRVTSLAFSPDGKLLASGSADGSVRLWGVLGGDSQSELPQTPRASPTAGTSTPRPVGWDPFVGEWKATDPVDGSNIMMSITGSEDGNYSITQIDDGSRGCGLDGAGKPKFGIKVVLKATAFGDTLNAASTSLTCLSTPASRLEAKIQVSFLYQASTDTIWDDANRVDWKRRK